MNPKYRRVRFEAWHIELLMRDKASDSIRFDYDANVMKNMELGNSWTLLAGELPIMCGGTLQQWPGRHTGWAFLNAHTGKHMLAATRCAHQVMNTAKGRIELTVRRDFAAGHRWARMLGFDIETYVMKRYGPDGEDHTGYVRFN